MDSPGIVVDSLTADTVTDYEVLSKYCPQLTRSKETKVGKAQSMQSGISTINMNVTKKECF